MNKNSINSTLKSLENFYLNKKFDKGIDFLLDHKKDLPISAFHYYFGSFELKLGHLAVGKYHLKLAVKAGYKGSDLLHNLSVVDHQLHLTEIKQHYPLKDKILFKSFYFGESFYLLLSLIMLSLLLFAYWREWIRRKRWLLVGALICCLPFAAQQLLFKKHQFAVTLKSCELREGPSKMYDVAGQVPAGLTVITGKTYNGQVYITLPSMYEGWVDQKLIGTL